MHIPMAYFSLPAEIGYCVPHRPSVPLGLPRQRETLPSSEIPIFPGLTANINELARVTLLSSGEICTNCRLVGVSDRGLDFLVEQAIAVDQTLILELRGHVLLGEVYALVPLAGGYRVSLAVEHYLDTRTVPFWSAFLPRPGS